MSGNNHLNEAKLYKLIGDIDPDIIAQANQPVPFRQKRGFKLALIAAVLAFAILLTTFASAFALVTVYKQANTDPSNDEDNTQFKPGGLVGELFGDINLDAFHGVDGSLSFGSIINALLGKEPENSETIGFAGFQSVKQDDGSVKITEFVNTGNETVIEIPETISGIKVSSIGKGAFSGNDSITHVSIPDSVTVIESNAFSGCSNLLTVDMSDYVTVISEGAFENCLSLTAIDLPDTLQYLGEKVFTNCENLTGIRIPDGISYIPDYTFYGTAITEVTIPSSVKEIGSYAFANCTALKRVNLAPNLSMVTSSISGTAYDSRLAYIGESAFDGTAINSLVIPDSVIEMYDVDFSECYSLQSLIFMGNAPTVFKNPTHDRNSSNYVVYYILGAQGFEQPEWNGYDCCLFEYATETYVLQYLGPHHYSAVPWLRVEIVSNEDAQVPSDPVTVIDTWGKCSKFADILPSEHYDRTYFDEYAVLLIKVKHTSYEQVSGLAGIAGQLYTMGGNYYLGLYPVIQMDTLANDVDSPGNSGAADLHFTYILAEVRRSDIRTDNVIRVGEVVVYDKYSNQDFQYHRGLVDFLNKENAKDGK